MACNSCEFVTLEDGFQYFVPKKIGALSAKELRDIADELDRRNAAWKKEFDKGANK